MKADEVNVQTTNPVIDGDYVMIENDVARSKGEKELMCQCPLITI